jgi:hypothetical protein
VSQVPDYFTIQISKKLPAVRIDFLEKPDVLVKVRGMAVVLNQGLEMFTCPGSFVTHFDGFYLLKASPLLPHRHAEPKLALIELNAISVNPSSPAGKLYLIEQHNTVRCQCFVDKPAPGNVVGLMTG